MRLGMAALAVVLAGSGCVAKSKYTALENQLQNCRERNKNDKGGNPEHKALLDQLKPLVDRGVLEVTDEGGRTAIAMRAEVLFPSGSAVLSSNGRSTVSEVGRVLGRRTDLDWQIEGHTDNEPIHTEEFPNNWHLGAARAMAVLDVMVSSGMSPSHVSAASFGQYAPVASNGSESGKQRNRRIEIVLLPEIRAKRLE
ncbi:MAG: OmpA family protein [Myxococcota bacterium]